MTVLAGWERGKGELLVGAFGNDECGAKDE